MNRRLRDILFSPRILLVITPIILLSGSLFSDKVLFWGTPSLQFIPWQVQAYRTLFAGDIPLWNPLSGMGTPLLANYQLALFYPPSWILIILYRLAGISGLVWGDSLLISLHLIWAGIGMSKFTKGIGVKNEFGQTISGLAFALGGYFTSRLGFFSIIWTGAWLPWLMYFATQISTGKKPIKLISFPMIISLAFQLLAGHAQLVWYSFILITSWVVFNGVWKGGIKGSVKPIHQLVIAYIFAIGIASIQLIPTGEFLLNSQRSSTVDFETALSYSFWPWRLITLFSPNFFGNPGDGNYWGYGNFWEDDVYMGLIPLILALSTIRRVLKNRAIDPLHDKRPFIIYFWLVIGLGMILASGRNTPIFIFLFRYIPTFDLFNAPSRYLIWVAFSLSALAGFGVDNWKKPEARSLFWFRLSVAACIGLSIGAIVTTVVYKNVEFTFVKGVIYTGIIGFSAGLVTLFLPGNYPIIDYKKNIWFATVLIVTDLLYSSSNLFPLVTNLFYTQKSSISRELNDNGDDKRVYININDDYRVKYKRFFTFESFWPGESWMKLRDVILPNLNLIEEVPSANNFDPLQINRYAEWIKSPDQGGAEGLVAWLQLMNVGSIELVHPRDIDIVRFAKITGGLSYRWFSCSIFTKGDSLALTNRNIAKGNGLKILVVEGNIQGTTTNCNENSPEISFISDKPRQLEIQVNSKSPGWLFFSKSMYPGWSVYLNGKSSTIYHADYAFMAVQVPAGFVNIILTYRPVSFFIGMVITFSTILVLFLVYIKPVENHII